MFSVTSLVRFLPTLNTMYRIQGDHSSWKVMEFSKTIFQAWKVMENSQGHAKSWKVMENNDDIQECQEQLMKLRWTDCFVTLKYL